MAKEVQRQVRWSKYTDTGEQIRMRNRYTFLILNEPREIRRIQERLFVQMVPIDELMFISDWQIPDTNGLHCKVFSFSSEKGIIENPEEIYGGSFFYDRNLRDADEASLEKYLERVTGVSSE